MIQTDTIWNELLLKAHRWHLDSPNDVIVVNVSGFKLSIKVVKGKMQSCSLKNMIGQPEHIGRDYIRMIDEVVKHKSLEAWN